MGLYGGRHQAQLIEVQVLLLSAIRQPDGSQEAHCLQKLDATGGRAVQDSEAPDEEQAQEPP